LKIRGNRQSRRYLGKVLRKISKNKLNQLVKQPKSFVTHLAKFGIILTFSNSALANPEGGTVVEGNATINNPSDTYMRVDQSSQKAVINWQDFSIDAGDHTHFAQPNASAITLNRVITNIPSEIYGKMTANGQVMLINQNGILFGAGSQVDVSGLVASTANISNNDFMSGNFDFNQSGNADATITNDGNITINNSGIGAFVAPHVTNNGIIQAHLGKISLAAGDKWVLDMGGEVKLALEDAVAGYLVQAGHLSANGGKITLAANVVQDLMHSAINVSGTVEATSVGMQNGEIVLFAGDGMDSVSGDVMVSGNLDVSGNGAGQTGGDVTIAGEQVAVYGGTNINADGDAGGGTILIGGDYQGGGDTPTATNVFVGSDTKITANAKTNGDGGKVIVWADDTTQFHGTIEAKGGNVSGDGGFVETSGKQLLSSTGNVDASATNGATGMWLLDPNNLTIQDAGSDTNVTASPNFSTTADSAIVTTASIETALDGGTSVTLTTSAGGAQDGDITVNDDIEKTAGGDASLTLVAHDSIIVNADIKSTSNKLNVTLNSDSDNSGAGFIDLSTSTIITNGGNIVMGGGADPLTDSAVGDAGSNFGVDILDSTLNSGVGNITLRGIGRSTTSGDWQHGIRLKGSNITSTYGDISLTGVGGSGDDYNMGIFINSTTISSTGTGASAGTITLNGTGGGKNADASDRNIGIFFNNSSSITSVDGDISLTGMGGSGEDNNSGIELNATTITSTGTGVNAATITLNGTGNSTFADGDNAHGVYLNGSGADITSVDGNISITGQGGDGDDWNLGVLVAWGGGSITSTGTGTNAATITIDGTGGDGGDSAHGVYIYAGSLVSSVDGDIDITGTGGDSDEAGENWAQGIVLTWSGNLIRSTGTGVNAANITLNGTAGDNGDAAHGVYLGGTSITTIDGDVDITGQGGTGDAAGEDWGQGVAVLWGAGIYSTGTGANAGNITLNGTAGGNEAQNNGVYLHSSSITTLDGNIDVTGTSTTANGNYNNGVLLRAGGILSSTEGDITIDAKSGTGTGSANFGIEIRDAASQVTSENGDISITGESRTTGNTDNNQGIRIVLGADVSSTGTTSSAGNITLNGTGGGTDDNNQGVFIQNSGTSITAAYGGISITGKASSSDERGMGIYINDSAYINSTGTGANVGSITLNGTGGGSGGNNDELHGVFLNNSASISSVDGDMSITGTGGNGDDNSRGVWVYNSSSITSSGTGANAATITINGTGGGGNTSDSDKGRGFQLSDSSSIASIDGNIHITGTGKNSSNSDNENDGIDLRGGSTITSTGVGTYAAKITLIGNAGGAEASGSDSNNGIEIHDAGTKITSIDGDISLTGNGGNGEDNNRGIEIDNNAVISSTGTGANAATITLNGTGGSSENDADNNDGLLIENNSKITSVDGNITLIGAGTTDIQADDDNEGVNIKSGASVSSTGTSSNAAKITITGTASTQSDDKNEGVKVSGSGTYISSVKGDISLTGIGGGGDGSGSNYNYGVIVNDNASISSTGTGTDAATITLNGTGGTDTDNYNNGIVVNNADIASVDGNISLTGTGGGDGNYNYGIRVVSGATLSSTGTSSNAATITLNGTGSTTGVNGAAGVTIRNGTTQITSIDGDINITGAGTGSGVYNNGVRLNDSADIISTSSADINITGTSSSSGSGLGLWVSSGSNVIGSSSMTGDLTLLIDSLYIADVSIQNTGSTTIANVISSNTIGIGDGASGDLQISDAELALFSTDDFVFGSTSGTGKMTVAGRTWSGDVTLQSDSGEIYLAGEQSVGSNSLNITGGSLTGGQDIIAGDVIIDVKDGVDIGTITTVDETTINFDTDNSGLASATIASIISGGNLTIQDGAGSNNSLQITGTTNVGSNNASIKADNITIVDTLTADIITLDATGNVTAKVSTDKKLNLSASSASLTGKINGGTGVRAALLGINTLNFTGGKSNFNFGSYKIGFDKTEISHKIQSYEKDFMARSLSATSTFNSFADSIDISIEYNSNVSSDNSDKTTTKRKTK